MAVIYGVKDGAIVDHELWMARLYNPKCYEENGAAESMKFQQLFELKTPYLMDGQAEKVALALEGKTDGEPKKKRRKKDNSSTTNDMSAEENHIQESFDALRMRLEFKTKFSSTATSEDYRRNNNMIREIRKRFTEETNTTLPLLNETSEGQGLRSKVFQGHQYILPTNVRYICDDVQNLLSHIGGQLFDVVVLDPPWLNKYVKRRCAGHGIHHGYEMMSVEDILSLPIREVLGPAAMVAVWCTNNPSIIKEFVAGLQRWGLRHVATWYWLKVTMTGEPVTPLGSGNGKRPYERILFAVRQEVEKVNIPDGLVVCSIPSGIHSHKPPLNDILQHYVGPLGRCLELFSRSVVPGWTSYGREVLRLNHSFLFQERTPSIGSNYS